MSFERMNVCKCDNCRYEILSATDGVAIQGNIYRLDLDAEKGIGGGLIGKNFPSDEKDFNVPDIHVHHYCNDCFKKIVDEE